MLIVGDPLDANFKSVELPLSVRIERNVDYSQLLLLFRKSGKLYLTVHLTYKSIITTIIDGCNLLRFSASFDLDCVFFIIK